MAMFLDAGAADFEPRFVELLAAKREAAADVETAAAGFAASGAKIAVICSTDKQYATVVAELAPKLKAAGARSVVLAGNPGASTASTSRPRR